MSSLSTAHAALGDLDWIARRAMGKARAPVPLPSVLTEAGFIREVLREALALKRVARLAVQSPDLKRRLLASTSIDWRGASVAQRKKAISAMSNMLRGLPTQFAPGAKVVLDETGAVVVDNAHRATGARNKLIGVDPVFALRNVRAVGAIRESTSIFFASEYERQAERFGPRAQRVLAQGLSQGLGTREIGQSLRQEFRRAGINESYWETVATVHVNRARSFSAMSSYASAGVTQYEVVAIGDERTTLICFPAGTGVRSWAGPDTPIERMVPGDLVRGRDGIPHEVEAVSVSEATHWIRVRLADGREIEATPDHPFWVDGVGWVKSRDLQPGVDLLSLRGADTPGQEVLLNGVRREGQEEEADNRSLSPVQVETGQPSVSTEEVLLSRVLREAPLRRGGVDRPRMRALQERVPGQKGLRQPWTVPLLRKILQGRGQKERGSSAALGAGVRRMLGHLLDSTVGVVQAARPLLHGVQKETAESSLRDVRRGIRGSADQVECPVLFQVVLSKVRGRIVSRVSSSSFPRSTGDQVSEGGPGRKIFGRFRPRRFLNSAGGGRGVLASTRRIEEGQGPHTRGLSGAPAIGLDPQGRPSGHVRIPAGFTRVRVASVETFARWGLAYNLHIADDPVYLVEGVLVHNCQMMDGRILSVAAAANAFNAFEQSPSLDEVKSATAPFMAVRGGLITVPGGAAIATINPDGSFQRQTPAAMNAAGVHMPPYHHRCRSTVVPVIPSAASAAVASGTNPIEPSPPKPRPGKPAPEPKKPSLPGSKRAILRDLETKGLVPGTLKNSIFKKRGTDNQGVPLRNAEAVEFSGKLAEKFEKIGAGVLAGVDPKAQAAWNKAVSLIEKGRDAFQETNQATQEALSVGSKLGINSIPEGERETRRKAFQDEIASKAFKGKSVGGGSFGLKTGRRGAGIGEGVKDRTVRKWAGEIFDAWGPVAEASLKRVDRIYQVSGSQRVHYSDGQRYFAFNNRRNFHHEFGHGLEYHAAIPRTRNANPTRSGKDNHSYWRKRVLGRDPRPAVRLRALTGNSGYDQDEVSKEDKWGDHYMGKVYNGVATEVVSMFSEGYGGHEGRWRQQMKRDPKTLLEFLGYQKALIDGQNTRDAAKGPPK